MLSPKILGFTYEPVLDVPENYATGFLDKKVGQKVDLLMNYLVIEKTKNYTILKVGGVNMVQSKRKF